MIIVKTIENSLEILKDPALSSIDKMSERREKLWEALSSIFNFEETSKRALGQYWLKLTPQERTDFTKTFSSILRDVYIGKSDNYRGEKIEYVREIVEGNRGKVQTIFHTVSNKKIVVDFSMKKYSGVWKIYDVSIEGVSMVSNYRSQFNSILTKSSFAELMTKLKDKKDEISG